MSEPIARDERNSQLDGLRGYAALAVVFFHSILGLDATLIDRVLTKHFFQIDGIYNRVAKIALTLLNGHTAVAIFFVLSGAVLFDSLRREQAKQIQIDTLGAGGLADRARGLAAELAQAGAQLELQRGRVASAQRTVGRYEQLVISRFVSEASLQQKQDELLDQRNQLAGLERSITGLNRDLAATRTELVTSRLKRDNNAAAIARQVSELEQQITEGDARRTVVLTAPAEGTVTTILAEVSQAVMPNAPLLAILPAGAELEWRTSQRSGERRRFRT